MFGFSKPTAEHLQVRANINLYKEMTNYRATIIQTGTARQLEEFDCMFNRVKDLFDPALLKAVDKLINVL